MSGIWVMVLRSTPTTGHEPMSYIIVTILSLWIGAVIGYLTASLMFQIREDNEFHGDQF